MASKEAELEALLYAAGDDGLDVDNLLQLLEISPSALRELANHLTNYLIKILKVFNTIKKTS